MEKKLPGKYLSQKGQRINTVTYKDFNSTSIYNNSRLGHSYIFLLKTIKIIDKIFLKTSYKVSNN